MPTQESHVPSRWTRALRQAPVSESKLLDQVRIALRSRHYSKRTEQTYVYWIKCYIFFRHPADTAKAEVNEFLSHLAITENVSASAENQALSALLFLYGCVLDLHLRVIWKVIRARKPCRLPVALTREEQELLRT